MSKDNVPTYLQTPDYLRGARSSFNRLSGKSVAKLEEIAERVSLFRQQISFIDEQLLPFMYDNRLFTGSDYWIEGLEWVEQDISRVERLSIDNTLILLTSALAKDDDKGADCWYRNGVIALLLKHLLQLKG